MDNGEQFGPWLGRQLRRQQMSQAELGALLGVTRAAVSAWITGRAQPRADMVQKIAAALGTDVGTVHARTADAIPPRPVAWYHRPAHNDGGREFGNAAAFAFEADLKVLAREATQNSIDERETRSTRSGSVSSCTSSRVNIGRDSCCPPCTGTSWNRTTVRLSHPRRRWVARSRRACATCARPTPSCCSGWTTTTPRD